MRHVAHRQASPSHEYSSYEQARNAHTKEEKNAKELPQQRMRQERGANQSNEEHLKGRKKHAPEKRRKNGRKERKQAKSITR